MVWTRTISGLKNFRIFTRKKYTAYCEGGKKSLAPQDVLCGQWNEGTEDAVFWRAIFDFTKMEVHVKSIGNCHSVDAMADLIIRENLSFSIACRDRDWLLSSDRKLDKRVLYTFGHAWETDILSPLLVSFVYADLSLCPLDQAVAIGEKYKKGIEQLGKACRWPLKLQYQSRKNDYDAVPTNRNLGGVIEVRGEEGVFINKEKLRNIVRRNKNRFRKFDNGKAFNDISILDIPGHAMLGFAMEFLKFELKKINKFPSNQEMITVFLSNFSNKKDQCLDSAVSKYYKTITSRL